MTQDRLMQRELVSALADGQLRGEALAQAVAVIEGSADARASWQAYHLIGDVLRSQELAAAHDAGFSVRLRRRLAAEAALPRSAQSTLNPPEGLLTSHAHAANGRWKRVAALASFAVLAVVGWQVLAGLRGAPAEPQLAQSAVPAGTQLVQGNTPQAQQRMLRDPHLDQLLAAHQQFGGTSAWQMPAGFLRNATYERPAR